jgi:broad specificity phosphatase PhoE
MVLKFIFIRHGEAQHNVDFHSIGQAAFTDPKNKDAPLTDLGHQQARDAAKQLSELTILDLWSSPLTRCIQTSEELFEELNIGTLYLHDNLLERQGGGNICNERKEKTELKKHFILNMEFLPEFSPLWIYSETHTSLHYRMKMFILLLADIYKKFEDGHILVVSHADAIGSLLYKSLKNAEYVILTLDEILNAKPEVDVTPPPTPSSSPRSITPI